MTALHRPDGARGKEKRRRSTGSEPTGYPARSWVQGRQVRARPNTHAAWVEGIAAKFHVAPARRAPKPTHPACYDTLPVPALVALWVRHDVGRDFIRVKRETGSVVEQAAGFKYGRLKEWW